MPINRSYRKKMGLGFRFSIIGVVLHNMVYIYYYYYYDDDDND